MTTKTKAPAPDVYDVSLQGASSLLSRWGYHVQVKDPEGTGFGAEIWFDGQKLHHVKRYVVDVGVDRVSEVTVTFNAQSVNREPLP